MDARTQEKVAAIEAQTPSVIAARGSRISAAASLA
jgi:hypothetical protein